MSGGGSTEATFVSDISSDVTLGSEAIKANPTFCGATKLVIPLTTSMLVGAFAVDAILKVDAGKLFDTQANILSSQVKVRHGRVEMSMNELFDTYMNDSERKQQMTSGFTIDFADSIQTTLTYYPATQLSERQYRCGSPDQAQTNANCITRVNGLLLRRGPLKRIWFCGPGLNWDGEAQPEGVANVRRISWG